MTESQALPRTGGQVLVDALEIHDVDTVFCVPGESYLAVLDALHDATNRIRTITCRQEGGAACMADAYARAGGKPGVLMVTRAPGACNASIGLHIAMQDSIPMVVLVGQIPRGESYRESFQEIDYHPFYGALCKWVAQVEDAARLPELISQAFHKATSGRPGPVALSIPEDMLTDIVTVEDTRRYKSVAPEVGERSMRELTTLLQAAHRPLIMVGGPGWNETARAAVKDFAETHRIPVFSDFRCMDRFDNTSECYVGDAGIALNPALGATIRGADLIIALGTRIGEKGTAGYTLIEPPCPHQKLVHVFPDPDEIGRVYQVELPICASVGAFAGALSSVPTLASERWDGWRAEARQAYVDYVTRADDLPGPLDMAAVMAHLRERLPANAILTSDAGNFSGWMQRHYHYRGYPTLLAPGSGAMGYGVPSAIAARLAHPDRTVIGFCGDGGALMSGQEVATAMHYGIDPVIVIVNNNMYGTIRMHQERDYPAREHATALTNPDFAAWARSFGAFGERVTHTNAFAPALERALDAGTIAILELELDPEVLTTRSTLSAIRNRALGDTVNQN